MPDYISSHLDRGKESNSFIFGIFNGVEKATSNR